MNDADNNKLKIFLRCAPARGVRDGDVLAYALAAECRFGNGLADEACEGHT
jgi:hypothetical protein